MLAVQERHARRARIDGNRAQPSGAECSAQRDLSLETADLQVGIAEVVPDIGSRQPIRRFDDPVGAAEQHAGNRSARAQIDRPSLDEDDSAGAHNSRRR
jgi:hypothetical protein